jgi:hypothetical protein
MSVSAHLDPTPMNHSNKDGIASAETTATG